MKHIKRHLLLAITHVAAFMAVVGIQPTSWFHWHQPEVPEVLKKK